MAPFHQTIEFFQNYTTTQRLAAVLEAPYQFGVVIKAGGQLFPDWNKCLSTVLHLFLPCLASRFVLFVFLSVERAEKENVNLITKS